MAAFIKIGDYANGTIADGDEFTAEHKNIYNAFNGTSTDREISHKFSGANPGIIIDQIGAGLIADNRKSGASVCPIGNDGKIANDNVIKRKHVWFVPSIFNNLDIKKTFLFPAGTGMKITRASVIMRDRTITFEDPLVAGWSFRKNGSVIADVFLDTIQNNAVDTEYFINLSVSVANGDRISIDQGDFGANQWILINFISIILEWEEKLG